MASVLSPQSLTAPQKAAPRIKLDYDLPFFGDLDTTSDPSLMGEENSPDTLNTVYDQMQSVASRQGYVKLLTTKTPSFIGGMYPLYQSTGTRQLLYASSTNLYIYNNAGGSTLVVGTPATFTANQVWSFDEYQDSVYGGNGTDSLIAYNGNSYTIANAGITPQFVKVRTNRIYCANKNSSTVYFSDAGNPTSFPVNNFIQINTNDGQNITSINELLGNLIIFKDESIWIMTGEPLGAGNTTTIGNLQLVQAASPVGCSAFRTVQKVGQSLFFMHYSGIYSLQNKGAVLISPLLSNTFLMGMNPGFISNCYGVYNSLRKKYIMGYPSATSSVCDSALVYDLQVQHFSRWDDIPGSCMIDYKFSGLQEQVLMGDPSVGNIYEMFQGYADVNGDNGNATGGSGTTLVDTTKSWTVNAFTDCRVMLGNNLGNYTTAVVASNTPTTLTFTTTVTAPTAGLQYSIGYYTSYWKSKIFDFGMTGYTKKYKYLNLFLDSENYPILFGSGIDYAACAFQKAFNMGGQSLTWDESGIFWDAPGLTWDTQAISIFGQANIGGTGRHIQMIAGNNLANQPWRMIKYSWNYKLKKERTNIVTV